MAIGFGYQALGRPLRPQETGVPDYVGSFTKGLEAGFKPSELSEKLLSSMLSNKINESKARHAEEMTLADLAHTRAGTQHLLDVHGMAGLTRQKLLQDVDPEAKANYIKKLSDAYNKMNGQAGIGGNDISSALFRNAMGLPPQTPEEKAALDYQQKIMLAEAARKAKKQEQYETSLEALRNSMSNEQLVENALSHTTTGIWPSLRAKFGLGAASLGELNEPATRMQAELARAISERGGSQAANIAATGKPSQWRSNAYNQAILKPIKTRQQQEYLDIKHDWEKKTGKAFPYKFSDFYKTKSGYVLMKKDGAVKKVPLDKVDDALEIGARIE